LQDAFFVSIAQHGHHQAVGRVGSKTDVALVCGLYFLDKRLGRLEYETFMLQ
jgi:hypothetical protein